MTAFSLDDTIINMTIHQQQKIAVIGAGAWGTALARLLAAKGNAVWLWFYEQAALQAALDSGENPFLPGFALDAVKPTGDLKEAVQNAEVVLLVNPAQNNRQILQNIRPFLSPKAKIINASKGIELDSFALMSEVIAEVAPEKSFLTCYLSGPSFAKEVAQKKITIVSLAAKDLNLAKAMQELLATPYFRPYITDDIIGVQVGGAVKNVIAIASGLVTGLAEGENAKAALITRGLAEISRLGLALGAKKETFIGCSGLGDLLLTADSSNSRNYSFGVAIGQGRKPSALIKASKEAVEGYWTTKAVWEKAQSLGIEMAITGELYQILFKDKDPRQSMEVLMTRDLKNE